ncbi:MAG: CpaD family pilus assembly protein [Beijerinckiaceae bacterium]
MSKFITLKTALALASALVASACARGPAHTGSVPEVPNEYRDRHPIVIAHAEQAIDIYAAGAARTLDARQRKELHLLARDYREAGRGPVRLLVPVGDRGSVNPGVGAVRATLAGAGVRSITQSNYAVAGLATEQPIRVSYTKIKAQTATKCGQWPDDLANSNVRRNWTNTPYYNFGCAYQNMIAQQTADPIDLVRSQPEENIDTQRRISVITAQRKGEDSSTVYRATETKINSTVGQ